MVKLDYDVIIMDPPPVGLVADGYLLMKLVDINIFVIRQSYTPIKLFKSVISEMTKHSFNNVSILFNDFKTHRSNDRYGGGLSNGYGVRAGYDSGYYSAEQGKSYRKQEESTLVMS